MAKIGDICEILDSKRVPITATERQPGPYPYYGANGIQDYVADYIFDDELVLLAEDGGNFGSKDKPIAYRVSGKCWVNNHAHVLKPKEGLDVDYLCYSLMFYDVTGLVNGATRQKLTQADMRKMEIPLPPLDEQRKIAAVLDKVNDLIAKRQQQLDKLDEMIKARFMEIFGDSETNTKNWRVLPMSKICSVGSSKRIYQSEQSSSGVPFWRISDLTSLITTGTVTPELYIPEERYKELKTQGQVPAPGDILITSRGTLGQCYIVKVNDRFYFQDGMISWLSGYMDGVTPLYISYLFTMPGFRKQIDSMQAGSTVAYLSITMIKKLKVMLPDIESQQQFASFVSKTEKTKNTISRSLEKLETLKKALMQEYFG